LGFFFVATAAAYESGAVLIRVKRLMTTTRAVLASSVKVRFVVLSRTTRISKTNTTKPRIAVRFK
jgi:hypothetical protein